MLNAFLDRFQKQFPPNRLALYLAPVLAIAAAAVAPWLAEHFPGLPQFSTAQLTAYGVAGAAGVIALAYRWLDGWQKHEERQFYGSDAANEQARTERAKIEAAAKVKVALIQTTDHPQQGREVLDEFDSVPPENQ